jgi:hypothetical protein
LQKLGVILEVDSLVCKTANLGWKGLGDLRPLRDPFADPLSPILEIQIGSIRRPVSEPYLAIAYATLSEFVAAALQIGILGFLSQF